MSKSRKADDLFCSTCNVKRNYRCEHWLSEQYYDNRMSISEVAEMAGVAGVTIRKFMDRHDLERRDRGEANIKLHPNFEIAVNGYVIIRGNESRYEYRERVGLHRLLAIAGGADPYKIFCEGYDVHHKNNIPWDNRPRNLQVMEKSEHARMHGKERDIQGQFTEFDKKILAALHSGSWKQANHFAEALDIDWSYFYRITREYR